MDTLVALRRRLSVRNTSINRVIFPSLFAIFLSSFSSTKMISDGCDPMTHNVSLKSHSFLDLVLKTTLASTGTRTDSRSTLSRIFYTLTIFLSSILRYDDKRPVETFVMLQMSVSSTVHVSAITISIRIFSPTVVPFLTIYATFPMTIRITASSNTKFTDG